MTTVIKAENISKQYRLGYVGSGSIKDDVKRWWYGIRGKVDPLLTVGESNDRTRKGESDYVWALKDINFEIQQGDTVGIIGRNGAGKSTLLKLLSKVTAPTTGNIKVKGRIASLLEVGTGFHGELTGRENIYLNGAIMGMRKHEITRRLDEIVDFAGVERYLDTPVKRYSSGMYVRLGFAVAAHLDNEILIVDEVLAVGDAEFQKKCLGKMGDVAKGEGRTILFVSHNMVSIQQLTKNSILMENGKIMKIGSTDEIVNFYHTTFKIAAQETYNLENKKRNFEGLSMEYEILSVSLSNCDNNIIYCFAPIEINIKIRQNIYLPEFRFSMTIFKMDGTPVGSFFSDNQSFSSFDLTEENYHIKINNHNLTPGSYYCGLAVGAGTDKNRHTDFDIVMDVLHFEVLPERDEQGAISNWFSGWGPINFKDITVEKTLN
jgi:lipopolysaccharide transport system ATP-binding protein